jgi:hypothetical protein
MSDKPTRTGKAKSPSETAREERLRAALRANLQKRKQQARARKADGDEKKDA